MELQVTNLNFSYTENFNISTVAVQLRGQNERNNLNAYIVLDETDGTLNDMTPRQITEKAIEKLKAEVGA